MERWITFDCFGTLVDWHGGFSDVLRPFAGARTPELLRAYHEFEPIIEAERPHHSYREVLVISMLRAACRLDIPISEPQAQLLPDSWGSLPIFPDVEPMLAGLRAKGYRLGVLTNCDEDLFAATHQKFHRPFDLVVTAERVRDYKPSPSHFRFFSRITGVGHDRWIHVACSWFHDVTPAREMGIKCIWLDRDRTGDNPSAAAAYVTSATDVQATVDRLIS